MQSSWPYFDGSSVTITVAYYSPPCGQNYHGIGITPDRIIDNEIVDGFLVDRQLEAAIEEMNSLINTN
jgi:carboxyl-terminal processing protease